MKRESFKSRLGFLLVSAGCAIGIGNVISAAMNQAFFTLSLGVAAMEIFGSYMSRENTLAGEGVRICVLDTFVAIMAGLIIFPACFSYGVEVNAGPQLIFITLPNVFVNMEGGRIWGTLFFLGSLYFCNISNRKSKRNILILQPYTVWLCKFCSTYYSHTYCCHLLTFTVFIEEERCSQSIVCPFHYYGSYFSFAIDVWLKLLYPCRSLYNSNTCNRKYFG